MAFEPQLFAPREFLTKLQKGEISRPIVFTGMVKTYEDNEHLLFAHGSNCTNWIKISLYFIVKVEVLDVVPCKDHTHPFVRLYLKQPETEEGILFSSLAHVPSIITSRRTSLLRIQRREGSIRSDKGNNCDDCPTWIEDIDGMWCFIDCDATSCIYRPCH